MVLTEGTATFCLKVILSQSKPTFVYIDALSEEKALAKVATDVKDDFAQVGVFFTDHILHQMAKAVYIDQVGEP